MVHFCACRVHFLFSLVHFGTYLWYTCCATVVHLLCHCGALVVPLWCTCCATVVHFDMSKLLQVGVLRKGIHPNSISPQV